MVDNIRITNPNMIRVGDYFYTIDHQSDLLFQKADDGTVAFAYPLDTPLSQQVRSLDHDGESFWSLEHIDGTPDNGFRIRRWVIEDFVLFLQQTFTFATNAVDTFESSCFALEKYEGTIVANGAENLDTVKVTFDGSADIFNLLTPGTPLFLGPSTKTSPTDFSGQTERVIVNSITSPNIVTLTAAKSVGFNAGDTVQFSKNLWVFNEHYLKSEDVGALYKVNAQDGSILSRTGPSGTFTGVNAAIFHNVQSFSGASPLSGFNGYYLLFIRSSNLLFIDVLDSNLDIQLSAVQDVISVSTTTIFPVFDLGAQSNTLFRLQQNFNIGGSESSSSTFNYQLATFRPFPTAIALTAVEPIIPAGNAVATSEITATVTDQYLQPFVTSPASTITFSTSGGGAGSSLSDTNPIPLNSSGQASVTYTSGATPGLVTIEAVVTIN